VNDEYIISMMVLYLVLK